MMKRGVVRSHFDEIAKKYDYYKKKNGFYYQNLKALLKNLIPQSKKILEIGCGTGDLLASLNPKIGYGMDLSGEMIKLAKSKHKSNKHIKFFTIWPSDASWHFDYIFMCDVIEHLENPKETFRKISKLMDKNSIFINTMANPIWEPILLIWEWLGMKMPEGPHKRIPFDEIVKLIGENRMRIVKHDYKMLIPIKIPVITDFVNKYLEKYFKQFAFIEYFVIKHKNEK